LQNCWMFIPFGQKMFKYGRLFMSLYMVWMLFLFLHARTLNVDIRFLGFNYTGLSINRATLLFFTAAFLPVGLHVLHVLHYDFHNPIYVVFFNCQRHTIFKANTSRVPLFHRTFLTTRVWIGDYANTTHDYDANRSMSKPCHR